ncbi:MAG: hypothetical protein QOC70_2390 [Verrucomicrobiota bacterium]|jgi:hypothetical protein
MAVEDQRAAVGFSITLSGQLIAAAMATLAVGCAYVSYALGARVVPFYFFLVMGAAGLLIFASIVKGGKGITKARNAGFNANWDLNEGKKEFNSQAISLAGALILIAVGFFLSGPNKEPRTEQKLESLCQQTEMLRKEIESHRSLDSAATGIENEIRQIRLQLQTPPPATPTPTPEAPVKKSRKDGKHKEN